LGSHRQAGLKDPELGLRRTAPMCPDRATGYIYIMSLRRACSVDTHKQAFVLDIPL
jgi:hypothetical protein